MMMFPIIASAAATLLIAILTGVEWWSAEHWAIMILVPLILVPALMSLQR